MYIEVKERVSEYNITHIFLLVNTIKHLTVVLNYDIVSMLRTSLASESIPTYLP